MSLKLLDKEGKPLEGILIQSDPDLLVDRNSITFIQDAATGQSVMRLKAVGSVANKVYKSGRIIPLQVQNEGVRRTVQDGRQLTGFIEHPGMFEDVRGDLKEIAAIIVDGPTMVGETTVITFQVATTPRGILLKQLLDSGVQVGVSQRALGRETPRTIEFASESSPDTPAVQVVVVEEIYGIFGYDFVHLDAANAGDATQVRRVSDSVLAASKVKDDTVTMTTPKTPTPESTEGDKTQVLQDSINATNEALKTSVAALGAQITDMATKLTDKLASNPDKAPKTAAEAMKAAVAAIMEDDTIKLEDKNEQLQKMAVQIQDAFSKLTGTPVDQKAVAKLQALESANKATIALTDAMKTMLSTESTTSRAKALTSKFTSLFDSVGGEGFSTEDKEKLKTALEPRIAGLESEDALKALIEDSLAMVNMGRAKERLVAMGYKPQQNSSTPESQVTLVDGAGDRSYLQYVQYLQDKCTQTGEFTPTLDHMKNKTVDGKELDPRLKKVMDAWDRRHGGDLRREQESALRYGGGKLTDATVHADFETPYTIARMVLFEGYADNIIMGLTSFGTMDNDRDQVPITKWRRSSTGRKTFVPNLKERREIKVGELQSIPDGKLTTEFFPIDASARKLRALLSDEFITRARRRPDITGIAMATQNLVDDVRRSLQQDIFYEMVKAALTNDAIAFTSAQNGDASTSIFQVTSDTNQVGAIAVDPSDAVAIVPESLTVTVTGTLVPEWGTSDAGGGPGGVFFYQVDHANGLIVFVDAAGNANPPPVGVANVAVTAGRKAGGLSAQRFNLNPGSVDHEVYMNRLLFMVQNLASAIPSATGYNPNILVQQRNLATLMTQAKAYQRDAARRIAGADGPVIDGNFGTTADLRHFASSVFPANFTVVGLQEATLYRVYEPLVLRGPLESRDTNGQLNGGKEWYSYQEDSLAVPLTEKLALITTYTE